MTEEECSPACSIGTQQNPSDSMEKAEIRALLRSHAPPPTHLASTLSTISAALQRHEEEILLLRARLARAEADYDALKRHSDDVRSVMAPIRRLPSEVLVQIFKEYEGLPHSDGLMAELARKPLLTVSQVCIRWHDIVLGTPTLWNTIELGTGYWSPWRWPRSAKKALALLRVILGRSANIPLHVSIWLVDGLPRTALIELVQHCERWKSAHFFIRSTDLQHLGSVREKLPLLEMLKLEVHGSPYVETPFEVAPRLRSLTLGREFPPGLPMAHLDKLRSFGCLSQTPSRVSSAVTSMTHLQHEVEFSLQLVLSEWDEDNTIGLDVPPTSSDIISFSMDVYDYFDASHCVWAMSDVFNSLTLSRLRDLKFQCQSLPMSLMYWPHPAFMGLAARSSFRTHLESLSLCEVVISEADLVEALAVLPLLQHLEISDHQPFRQITVDHVLITTALFSALTLKPEAHTPHLVPLLQSLLCHSRLEFDDTVYLGFLVSRRRQDPGPFVSRMYWLPGRGRDVDPDVAARIRELCIRKELACEFAGVAV